MKGQDILFILVLLVLISKRSPRLSIMTGMTALLLAFPLFSFWIFFTAERLTMYAAGSFILSIGQIIILTRKSEED